MPRKDDLLSLLSAATAAAAAAMKSIIVCSLRPFPPSTGLSFPALKPEQFGREDVHGAFLPAPACHFYDPFIQSTSVY